MMAGFGAVVSFVPAGLGTGGNPCTRQYLILAGPGLFSGVPAGLRIPAYRQSMQMLFRADTALPPARIMAEKGLPLTAGNYRDLI